MNNAVDRLSGLPSPLLDHILSFLPTKDVVRTCVLSKSWRNVWCYLSSFRFNDWEFSGNEDFVKFVDSALFLRDGSNIRKLHLTIGSKNDINDYTMYRINKWILYAIRHNVEVLEMILNLRWTSTFEFTSHIFTCKSLRELRLTSYQRRLKLPASCLLPSLKFLQFSYICFMDVQMTTFESSAFPSLETLILEGCNFESNNFCISVPHLNTLHVEGWGCGDMFWISADLDTPNLISFKMEITDNMVEFVEFNPISLVNANINLCPRNLDSFIKLIRALECVRSLTLNVGNLMTRCDLSILACIQTPFYNMKWLKIQTSYSDGDIGMINTLLEHSYELETFFLEHKQVQTTPKHCYEAKEVWFKHKLPHLKLVEIQGFRGFENEVKLAKFILENAIILEKLIIMTSKFQKDNKHLTSIGRKLLSSPQASPSVGILFD